MRELRDVQVSPKTRGSSTDAANAVVSNDEGEEMIVAERGDGNGNDGDSDGTRIASRSGSRKGGGVREELEPSINPLRVLFVHFGV